MPPDLAAIRTRHADDEKMFASLRAQGWNLDGRPDVHRHIDRAALLAALDAATSLLDTYREAERLACITVHELRAALAEAQQERDFFRHAANTATAALARIAAVTPEEVAEAIISTPGICIEIHVPYPSTTHEGCTKAPDTDAQAAAVVALYAARVAGP